MGQQLFSNITNTNRTEIVFDRAEQISTVFLRANTINAHCLLLLATPLGQSLDVDKQAC